MLRALLGLVVIASVACETRGPELVCGDGWPDCPTGEACPLQEPGTVHACQNTIEGVELGVEGRPVLGCTVWIGNLGTEPKLCRCTTLGPTREGMAGWRCE